MPSTTNAVVTGATSGIGEAVARNLVAGGMHVTLVGRDDDRLDQARRRILASVPDAGLRVERADLSLLGEVRGLAERLADPPPDVVVSNAAVIADVADRTQEGHQRTLVTNHLAPYLLLRSLVEPIGTRRARFVVVGASPRGLARVPVDLDDPDIEQAVTAALDRLPESEVLSWTSYWSPELTEAERAEYVSEDRSATIATPTLRGADTTERLESYGEIEDLARADGGRLETYLAGGCRSSRPTATSPPRTAAPTPTCT